MSVIFLARWSTKGRPRVAWVFVALGVLSCGPPDRPVGERDDLGGPLPRPAAHARIVSLSPATTELLFALGAGDRLVGRTHWDAWPPAAHAVPDVGDGIRPSIEVILATRPDLVVLYATADNADAARAFRAAGIDVIAVRMDRIEDFGRVARILGDATATRDAAEVIVDSVGATLDRVRAATDSLPRPTVFLHSWDQPLIAIGGGSYLSQLIEIAGARNIFGEMADPSPQVSFEEVLRRDPDFVLGGPQTAANLRSGPRWQALAAVREGRILVMDTTLVSRPGTRLGEAAVSLARLLHPGVLP